MFHHKDKFYFFISEKFEQFDNSYYDIVNLRTKFDIYGINKEKTSNIGTTCMNILNSYENIIKILNECIDLNSKPFYKLQNYLESKSNLVNKNILEIIFHELETFYFKENDKVRRISENIQFYKKELVELKRTLEDDNAYNQYYDDLIEDTKKSIKNNTDNIQNEEDKKQLEFELESLRDLEKEKANPTLGRKSIMESIEITEEELEEQKESQRNLDEVDNLLKKYIKRMINTITNYKKYFDLVFKCLDKNLYSRKDLKCFESIFRFQFSLPKTYIYNIFEENNFIKSINGLFVNVLEEYKEKNIDNLEEYLFKTIQNMNYNYCKIYEINKLEDILNIYLSMQMEKKIVINKCKNCGKYFIPANRTDEQYCNNISPQNPNKTCKEYGAPKTYRDKMKSMPIKNEHNKTSQFFRMRIKRANDKNNKTEVKYYTNKFEKYKINYQSKKDNYEAGKLKEEDFIEWIISQKEGEINGSI